ncbi:cation channel sperm-associated auxiliary subunit gamma-like [Amphiura filiformis]|uniref:cation channel sperm-associated auxiliary subunit gamma-like n=1 Tax=Amphiura filiformis TaxID=82378 RepID=UPI003B2120F6
MNVLLGCAPGTRLIFDLNSTLEYTTKEFGVIYDCPAVRTNPDMPCFYYKQAFHPFFQVLDLVTGRAELFTGNYTFRVIGGSQEELTDIRYYDQKEQELYNLQDHGKDETLIWIPIEEEIPHTNDSTVIFNHEHSGVILNCQQYSACADVPLQVPYAPEYYFLIEVSNRYVDASRTYCNYTLQFIIRVHGFPISPMRSIRIVLWTFFIICSSLLIFVVWNHNKQHPFVKPAFLKRRKPKIIPAVVVQDGDGSYKRKKRGKNYQSCKQEQTLSVPAISVASSEQVLDVYSMESAVFRKLKREQDSIYSMTEASTSDARVPGGDAVPLRPSTMATSPIPEEPSMESNL